MIKPAERIGGVEQYYFAKKLGQIRAFNAANATQIINLGIGSPDLAAPTAVIETVGGSARIKDASKYQSYTGIPSLRAGFASWYKRHFDVTLDSEREILPLLGSKEGIMHLSMAFLEEGDEVLVPDPGYPAYAACSKIAGATIRRFDLLPENGYLPDLDLLEQTDLSKVKMMWINYPNMPTGAVADRTFFERIIRFGERYNILICHDNPYTFILNESPRSILQGGNGFPWALELTSLSKNYNMAGWRVGAMAADKYILQHVLKFKSNMDSGMYKPIQEAAVKALGMGQDWFDQINAKYEVRKGIAQLIIGELSCPMMASEAGMFLWAKVPGHMSGEEMSDLVLREANVFITPGFIFGDNGANYIRLSLCADEDQLKEALARIVASKIDLS